MALNMKCYCGGGDGGEGRGVKSLFAFCIIAVKIILGQIFSSFLSKGRVTIMTEVN